MNTQPEALRLAGLLETDGWPDASAELRRLHEEIQALRQALAQPEQEPVAWVLYYNNEHGMPMRETFYAKAHMEFHKSHNETQRGLKCQVVPLYTAPPKREWVGLTDREITKIGNLDWDSAYVGIWYDFAKAIEAKLKEKNSGSAA